MTLNSSRGKALPFLRPRRRSTYHFLMKTQPTEACKSLLRNCTREALPDSAPHTSSSGVSEAWDRCDEALPNINTGKETHLESGISLRSSGFFQWKALGKQVVGLEALISTIMTLPDGHFNRKGLKNMF